MPKLRIEGTGVVIETRDGEAILPALIRTGYSYKFGCKRGGCGICKLDLVEGEIEYPVTVSQSILSEEEKETCVLSCRAVPTGDAVIRMNPDNMFKSVAPFFANILNRTAQAITPPAAKVTVQVVASAVTAATDVSTSAESERKATSDS